LLGAGFIAVGSQVRFAALLNLIVMPLLLSPVIAIVLCYVVYGLARKVAPKWQSEEICVCAEEPNPAVIVSGEAAAAVVQFGINPPFAGMKVAQNDACESARHRRLASFRSVKILDSGHYLSAGLVSFARV
jgi:PiT family inorganic phosphate transporter